VVEERLSIEYSCAELVPEKYAPLARRAARKAAAVRALRRARQLWRKGQRAAAWRQFSQGSRCSLAPSVLAHLAYFLMRTVLG